MVRSFENYHYGSSKVYVFYVDVVKRVLEAYFCSVANAASHLGFEQILDMHSPLEPSIGWNKLQYTIAADGSRHSSFRAYLPQSFATSIRHLLHISTRAVAAKITFSSLLDGRLRADSVEVLSIDGGHRRVVKARREIVLACGALGTPKVLLLRFVPSTSSHIFHLNPDLSDSGVGPKDHLEEMGIEVVRNSPGVGAHLASEQRQYQIRVLIISTARSRLRHHHLQLPSLGLIVGYDQTAADSACPPLQLSCSRHRVVPVHLRRG